MSPEEENQYFRRLLSLHPTLPLGEQRERVLTEADKVMQRPPRSLLPGTINYHEGPLPYCGVRWEYQCIEDTAIAMQNDLGAQGWEAYAAAFNSNGKQVIWMKRRLG